MKTRITKRELLNIIIIHVARTWERVRLTQPFEEMPQDNIESIESILEIADKISNDKVITKFMKSKDVDFWEKETKEGFSDWYIENLAEKIITKDYLEL